MDLKSIVKSISFWIIFVWMLILPNFGMAYTAEFEIEEIITAIKSDGGFNFNIIDVKDIRAQNIATHYVTIKMKLDN